jgi:hypothetical protein
VGGKQGMSPYHLNGEFVAIGLVGFVAQLILSWSLDDFDGSAQAPSHACTTRMQTHARARARTHTHA